MKWRGPECQTTQLSPRKGTFTGSLVGFRTSTLKNQKTTSTDTQTTKNTSMHQKSTILNFKQQLWPRQSFSGQTLLNSQLQETQSRNFLKGDAAAGYLPPSMKIQCAEQRKVWPPNSEWHSHPNATRAKLCTRHPLSSNKALRIDIKWILL